MSMNATVEHMRRRGPRKRNIKSRVIRVRISEDLYQHLMNHAEETRRSVSEIVRYAIREWMDGHEEEEKF